MKINNMGSKNFLKTKTFVKNNKKELGVRS